LKYFKFLAGKAKMFPGVKFNVNSIKPNIYHLTPAKGQVPL